MRLAWNDAIPSVRQSLRDSVRWSVAALVLCASVLAIAVYLVERTGVAARDLYRDPNTIASNPFYFGILESLTAAILLTSGAILVFTALTERWPSTDAYAFASILGALTVTMGLDDLLMLHESASFVHWRLDELHVYLAYALVLAFALLRYWRLFLATPAPLLLASLGVLAIAAVEDSLAPGLIYEDYTEIVGFSLWFAYIVGTSVVLKTRHVASVRSADMPRPRAPTLAASAAPKPAAPATAVRARAVGGRAGR